MNTLDSLISRKPGVMGGRPCINGTRISVRAVALRDRCGDSPEEILDRYAHLTLAQVYAALAYYHANRSEIDADILAEQAEHDRLAYREAELLQGT